MRDRKPNILLVAYQFPPYASIGAYRWTNFVGRLASSGYTIEVLTAKWPHGVHQPWHEDICHPNISIHRTKTGYPLTFKYRNLKARIIQIVRNRLMMLYDYLFTTDDEAENWHKYAIQKVKDIHKKKHIDCIISTGPPYSVNVLGAKIQQDLKTPALIQDFRDPWITRTEDKLPPEQRDRMEFACGNANCCVSVTEEMTELQLHMIPSLKTETIHNGYDGRISNTSASSLNASDKKIITYIGSLFNQREAPLNIVLEWVRSIEDNNRPIVQLVGRKPSSIARNFPDLISNGNLILIDHVTQDKALGILCSSDFALQLNAPIHPTQVSTKVYEYAALRVPTISINYGGAIDRLVRLIDSGFSIDARSSDVKASLTECISGKKSFKFDVGQFEFDHLANQYGLLIDKICQQYEFESSSA